MGAAYDDNIKMFYKEHMHEDEEIRWILEGGGYFDVRDEEDKWVRIEVGSGDLVVLPAGCYHRFMVDEDNVGFFFLLFFAVIICAGVLFFCDRGCVGLVS